MSNGTYSKWTSRKFWMAVIGDLAGLITLFWGAAAGDTVTAIGGVVLMVLVTWGYLKAEGDVDKARAEKD